MDALLGLSDKRHNAIEFDKVQEKDFIPALKKIVADCEVKLKQYRENEELGFESVIEKLSEVTESLDYISSIFYCLYSAHATDDLRNLSQEFSGILTDFSNKISMDEKIFERVKNLYDTHASYHLSDEQKTVLEKTYLGFTRNGALLNESDKETLKGINKEMSELSLKFSDNVLQSINKLFLHVKEESRLAGLPSVSLAQAKEEAKQRDLDGYVFTLQYPSYLPFMKYCKDRDLRKEMYYIAAQKGRMSEHDNSQNVKREVELRLARAKLLGFESHADYTLKRRMAGNVHTVNKFIEDIYSKAYPKAQKEYEELSNLATELDGVEDFSPWDSSFYSEILKKKKLDFNDEILKPYFSCDEVVSGVFKIAKKLFDLDFKEVKDLPIYHEEVRVFEASENGKFIGLFYMDLFPRSTKKSGAWMTNFLDQGMYFGKVRRPHVGIVCNFTKPSQETPSLLTLNEVLTLFHEFGHALHGLLSQCEYRDVSGTSVFWDFVELPSQIMENWVKEKECLEIFAKHYQTGDVIPDELITKIKQSNQFLEGMATIRQLSFATLDMAWHSLTHIPENLEIKEFEDQIMKKFRLGRELEDKMYMSFSFSHLFAGGYSAGYYSYKWAEVLDADAFNLFEEEGIFSKETALSFKENILSRGGSEDPMELFKKFRGREPDASALMKRAGLA